MSVRNLGGILLSEFVLLLRTRTLARAFLLRSFNLNILLTPKIFIGVLPIVISLGLHNRSAVIFAIFPVSVRHLCNTDGFRSSLHSTCCEQYFNVIILYLYDVLYITWSCNIISGLRVLVISKYLVFENLTFFYLKQQETLIICFTGHDSM